MQKMTKKELKEQRHAERVAAEAREAKKKKIKDIAFWGGFALLLLASIAVIFFLARPKPSRTAEVTATVNSNLPPVTEQDYQVGPKNAKVTLIEYGDFQCPACAHYFPMVTQLKEEYKDSVRVVFRNFPLPSVHKNALIAAQAAYAAGKQGKFWEMHDLLYKNQTTWAESDTADQIFTQYAVEMDLDPMQFTTDMMSSEATTLITAQTEGGSKSGVAGTPTFYLNGRLLTNPVDYNEFKSTIEQEMSK